MTTVDRQVEFIPNWWCQSLIISVRNTKNNTSDLGKPSWLSKTQLELFGALDPAGFKISSYKFNLKTDTFCRFEPLPCFVDVWINLGDQFSIKTSNLSYPVEKNAYAVLYANVHPFEVQFQKSNHNFIHFQLGKKFISNSLPNASGNLHPVAAAIVANAIPEGTLGDSKPFHASMRELATTLHNPPVIAAARALWFRAKALELSADVFFQTSGKELFCSRQKRVTADRVTRTKQLLKERISDPPTLQDLASKVGCSPYYLSRTFSKEVGLTIPQYIREIRIERAAELLRTGQCNVTEAAFEVGYNSPSHFSHAFCQKLGVCPAMYPKSSDEKD